MDKPKLHDSGCVRSNAPTNRMFQFVGALLLKQSESWNLGLCMREHMHGAFNIQSCLGSCIAHNMSVVGYMHVLPHEQGQTWCTHKPHLPCSFPLSINHSCIWQNWAAVVACCTQSEVCTAAWHKES